MKISLLALTNLVPKIPPPPPTPSSTNLSSGEEGEGPKNKVDSLLSIVRYQKKSSKHQSVVVYFLTLLKMS